MDDELDNYIQSQTIEPARQKIYQAAQSARARGVNIPDDVANEFYDAAGHESGRSQFNADGSVKLGGLPVNGGQRAIGFSQIMPATAKPYQREGLDPNKEQDNIEMGLREFYKGDPHDSIARRLAYVGGPANGALKQYRQTGTISNARMYPTTKSQETYRDYVNKTGGLKSLDNYILNQNAPSNAASSVDDYIKNQEAPVADLSLDDYIQNQQPMIVPSAPVPEPPATLAAQLQSVTDATSPKAAILTTEPNGHALIGNSPAVGTLIPVPQPNGGMLWINKGKAAKLGIHMPEQADAYIRVNGRAGLMGKVDDVGDDTGPEQAAVATRAADGTELSSSIVKSPESAQAQVAVDSEAYPGSTSEVTDSSRVILDRMRAIEPVPTATNELPTQMPQPQPQQPLLTRKDGQQFKVLEDRGKMVKVQDEKGSITLQPKRKFVTSEAQISAQDIDPETGAPIPPQQLQQAVVDAKHSDNAVAETIQIPDNLDKQHASDYVRKQLEAKYGGDYSHHGFLQDYTPGNPIAVTYGDLKAAGVDTAPLIQQKVAERRTEAPQQDLRSVLYDFSKEDADTINKTLKDAYGEDVGGHGASVFGAGANALSSIGNLVGGVADLINTYSPVTGATKEIVEPQGKIVHTGAENMIDNMKNFSQGLEDFAGHTGNKVQTGVDPISKEPVYQDTWPTAIVKYAGKTAGDLAALMIIPGGPIAAFPINEAAVTKIKGGSGTDVLKSITKGVVTGALFGFAGELPGLANVTKPLLKEGIPLATIAGGTATIGYVSGDKPTDILTSMLTNSAWHLFGVLHKAVSDGKTLRIRDEEGRAVAGTIKPDGQLVSVDASKPADVEMLLPKAAYKGSTEVALSPEKVPQESAKEEPQSKPDAQPAAAEDKAKAIDDGTTTIAPNEILKTATELVNQHENELRSSSPDVISRATESDKGTESSTRVTPNQDNASTLAKSVSESPKAAVDAAEAGKAATPASEPAGSRESGRAIEPDLKQFEKNKIVTADKVQAARDVLKKIQFNVGLDPEAYQALVTIGAAHVESGVRKFADFSQRMVDEFGDKVKPHLEAIWNTVKGTYKDFQGMDEPPKERGLAKTLEAAQLEKGNQTVYQPERIPGSKEVGRAIIANKGIDGAKEAVLSRSIKPNTNWASTGFAVMEHQQNEIAKVRSSDPAKADQLYKEHQDFVGDFTRLATENGQMSAGIRAVQEFAPDKLQYFANKASQKGRDKPLSRQESEKITELGNGLTKERDIQKGLDQQIQKATEASETQAGKLPKKETYLDALERSSNDAKTAILAKLGKLDLAGLKKEKQFEGQKGAIGEKKALPGDAELLAQYAAGRLHKVDTVEALDKEMVDTFGKDVESLLPDIHRRAYELRQEARIAALEAKDSTSESRRTILQDIRQEIKAVNDDAKAGKDAVLKEAKDQQKAASKAFNDAVKDGKQEQIAEARQQAKDARQRQREIDKGYADEAKAHAKAFAKTLAEAKAAERKGIMAERKAKREEERRSNFWDTPTRQIADEAKTRLKDANPNDPNVMVDLASVGAEKFLPDTPGGTPRKGNISPSKFYREMQEEYPDLVTNKNRKEVFKQSFQRITDTQNAAREASKLANASAAVTKLWKEQGIDVNTQALLIQKAASVKRDMQMRNAAAQEFAKVSRPLYKVIASEIWHSPRALMTSLNIHQGRQGLMTLLSHPYSITAKVSVPQSLKGLMASHEDFLKLTQELKDSPGYDLADRSGLNFAELPEASATPKGFLEEDQLQGRWAQKLPWVRRSTQGFVLGMNAERLALFNRWATLGEAHNYTEESNPEFYKSVAKLANDFTGRGQAPEAVERFLKTPVISELFFAPRLKVSQVMALNDLLNPFNYFGKNAQDPVLRSIKAKETLRVTAGAALLYSTLIMLGGKGTDDPDDPDFFKVKFGHTHYDLSGGVGGTLRFMYKFFKSIGGSIAGEKQSEYEQPVSIAGHFLRQKLGPWPGAALNYFEKKDVVGQPSNLKVSTDVPKMMHENIALKMVLPLIVNEIAEGVEDDGWRGLAKTAPASAFGFTEQTYAPSVRSAQKALDEATKSGKGIEQARKDLDDAQKKVSDKKVEAKQEKLTNPTRTPKFK